MAVDVVVINYHTDVLLKDFVNSYGAVAEEGDTLTVVDVDVNERQFPAHWMCEHVNEYMPKVGNVGYGKACNDGAAGRTNDVILLANADTLLTVDFKACHDALMERPDWGVLGPRQVNEYNQITAGGIIGTDKSPSQRGWNEPDNGQFSDILEDALSVSGALYFIKRTVWEELTNCELFQQYQPGSTGAFLETPHYFEEMFCSLHARAHGYKCVFYGPARMVHYWHRASVHGGWADQQFSKSQAMHREACALHGIPSE